jgi:hypothetical protein
MTRKLYEYNSKVVSRRYSNTRPFMTPMIFIHLNRRKAATPLFVACSFVVLVYYDYRTVEYAIYDNFRTLERENWGGNSNLKFWTQEKRPVEYIYI